ncbi:copper-binding protein [Sphingomonas sp. Leaf24]|uniref:copper resistance system multicopper oxidase n=1 Tax=unclassified Sphingomonas TaxID=196159 RepID=UPI0006F44AA9|nr:MULTISPECIES: copper resistance system multicopper oxidase [unclassified Sphingomonas]KQM19784.1 copper-binding protein [Sphingomonas sp. Leaf5]KQM91390.1 copper-binding protein [Sphingomonas sp. Leaf24]
MTTTIDRRRLLRGAALGGGAMTLGAWTPLGARQATNGPVVSGDLIELRIGRINRLVDGRPSRSIGINGMSPAPLIRLREGQRARIRVVNDLDVETSLHWHGLLVPFQYDGVPGISFPGIPAGQSFLYDFPVRQNGTYWYHSHSGGQEQAGLYGPIVIDPAAADPVAFDREHVIVLSDHSRSSPATIFRRMKLQPGYYNFQRQTLAGLLAGRDQPAKDRAEWGKMRMDPADIADATGATYTYLVNGHGPVDNWTGAFTPGERVRLRIVNASAMTTFNVRIPGLPLTIVQSDGLNVEPVTVDEFQIGVAETYDAIVTPGDAAYTLVGESVDRSGMARATLTPRPGLTAPVPPLRARPLATMTDMGMGGMGHEDKAGAPDPTIEKNASARLATQQGAPASAAPAPDHAAMGHGDAMGGMAGMEGMGEMKHGMRDFANAPGVAKTPGVQTISPMAADRTDYPGQGLEDVGHRVLTYRQLRSLDRNPDVRAPGRQIDIHLTGNMERFMWGFDGKRMVDTHEPFAFAEGERVRINLINDTMMAHPIHLHGHFFELVTGHGDHSPRKHTVLVQPGGIVSLDLTADAVGDWAFHCHMLYHMLAGMMRVVTVRPQGSVA